MCVCVCVCVCGGGWVADAPNRLFVMCGGGGGGGGGGGSRGSREACFHRA